jgi:hypothetical protein
MIMIGFNPTKAQIGDLAVKITHNKFMAKAQV